MTMGAKPVWAGRNMRLDPFRLPQAVSYATRDDFGEVSFFIDRRGVTMRRILKSSGLPATIILPASAFRGVTARALEDEDGTVTVTLELMHNDPMLSVPLLVAGDLDGQTSVGMDAYGKQQIVAACGSDRIGSDAGNSVQDDRFLANQRHDVVDVPGNRVAGAQTQAENPSRGYQPAGRIDQNIQHPRIGKLSDMRGDGAEHFGS
jgi:hypothetical protein